MLCGSNQWGLTEIRFDLDIIALGYVPNLEWSCCYQTSLQQSNLNHWTIVGEFTGMPVTITGS